MLAISKNYKVLFCQDSACAIKQICEWVLELPDFSDRGMVADFSSTILSYLLDVSRFEVIYTGTQKNVGPAGFMLVIVRENLLHRTLDESHFYYDTIVPANHSRMNVPFQLESSKLDALFLKESQASRSACPEGYRIVSGMRVHCTNAIPLTGVQAHDVHHARVRPPYG